MVRTRRIREKLRDPIKQIKGDILALLIIIIVAKKDIILDIITIGMELMC